MENNDKNLYEIGYLLIPIIPAEKISDEVNVLKSYIESNGGVVMAEEQPKMRDLSYEILHRVAGGKNSRYDTAHFGWVKFDLSPLMVKNVEAEIKKNPSFLRYLVINLSRDMGSPEKIDTKKTPIIKKPKKIADEVEIDKEIDNLLVEDDIVASI